MDRSRPELLSAPLSSPSKNFPKDDNTNVTRRCPVCCPISKSFQRLLTNSINFNVNAKSNRKTAP